MLNTILKPKFVNFELLRINRQNETFGKVYNMLINNINNINLLEDKSFISLINEKKLHHIIKNHNEKYNIDIFQKCLNDYSFADLLAEHISKNATRQGSNDEKEQIEICNKIAQNYNIKCSLLPKNAYRPVKNRDIIISNNDMKSKNISKNDCFKSFDGKIEGINKQIGNYNYGFMCLKVVYNSGGHQDNVFHEMDDVANWVKNSIKYKELLFVILIDTNLHKQFEYLKNKYIDVPNLIIKNHYEFQEYIIQNCSVDNI